MNDADKAALKETRRELRLVQAHLIQSRLHRGAAFESHGFIDLIYHSESRDGYVNYITPRKNTAWISAKDVEAGLKILRERERTARIEYIEGLFLPQFAKTLIELGLQAEHETPLMLLSVSEKPARSGALPDGIAFSEATDAQSAGVWWYIFRCAYYDVLTHTAPPEVIGRDLYHIAQGQQTNWLVYRQGIPVGAVRVTHNTENQTAHIEDIALMHEIRSARLYKALIQHVITDAIQRGASLIFTAGTDEREILREYGFFDCGSVICYAENLSRKDMNNHGTMEQPVLTIR